MKQNFLKSSLNPLDDIESIAYLGQPFDRRMYKSGYEDYFESFPELNPSDKLLDTKIEYSKAVMQLIATAINKDHWRHALQPLPGGFNRTIIGMESPIVQPDGQLKEGTEVVVARWGDGHTSPVHGHAAGYLHEELLFGKMRVNTYRIVDAKNRIVRPLRTDIYDKPGTIASLYTPPGNDVRSALVHNFTSIGFSGTLHYLPEHTRDGRDNQYEVEYYEDRYGMHVNQIKQITAKEGLSLKIGDVALVRSENVPEYGDHYIVITGSPVLKEHGLRPQDIAIYAPHIEAKNTLDSFEPIMGLTLLKLNDISANWFRSFHGIQIQNNFIFNQ